MYIYIGIIVITIILVSIYDFTKKKIFYILSMGILSIFSGIRYYVGTDYENYMIMFRNAKETKIENFESDVGFLLISKFISLFTENYRVHFIIISIITVMSIMIYIYLNSKIKFISVMIYLSLGMYFSSFNIVRQHLAIAIVIWAINLINTKRRILFYLIVLFASSIHITATILLPMKIILEKRWTKLTYGVIAILTGVIYVSSNFIINIFNNDRINRYSGGYYTTTGSNYLFIVVYLFIFIFCIFYLKKIELGINNKHLKLMFLGLMFIILSTKGLIFSRMAGYFNVGIFICIPNLIYNWDIEKEERNFISYLMIISLFLYSIIYVNTQGGLIPYRIF